MDDSDDFVAILPATRKQSFGAVDPSAVMVSHVRVGKAKTSKLIVTLPRAVYDQLCPTAPRASVAYSARKTAVRLTQDLEGPYEVVDVPPGKPSANGVVRAPRRKMVRFVTPEGVAPPDSVRRQCRHEVVEGSLVVHLPGDWYRTYSSTTPDPGIAGKQTAKIVEKRAAEVVPRVQERPRHVVTEPGMPPPGRSALDRGAKPGDGLVGGRR